MPEFHRKTRSREGLVELLQTYGWVASRRGELGGLWVKPEQSDKGMIAVPAEDQLSDFDWSSVITRLADAEQATFKDLAEKAEDASVDITRLSALTPFSDGTILVQAGMSLVLCAHSVVRSTATTSFSPRGHIGGRYSKTGDAIVARVRMAQTEEGSYVVPVRIPLSREDPLSAIGATSGEQYLGGLERKRLEPAERRVTRTIAQALSAIDQVVVRPEKEPQLRDLHDVVSAGASQELISAISKVTSEDGVEGFSARFQWAPVYSRPSGLEDVVIIDSQATGRLQRAAKILRTVQAPQGQVLTGPLVEVRHLPQDPYGSVSVDTVRNGRRCEVRVQLSASQIGPAYEWARTERPVLAQGPVLREGRGLWMRKPDRFLPLDEIYLH